MKYGSWQHTFIFRSNVGSHSLIIPMYDVHISNGLQDIRQNHWNIKYGSGPTFILRSKCRVTQTHNPKVKVKSLDHEIWVTATYSYFEVNIRSHRLIIPKNAVHTLNGLQDIRQNHWTIKYGPWQPTFILRSNVGSHTHNPKVRCSFIKWSSRYKAKSVDHEIQVTVTYIYFQVKFRVTRTHNPKVRCSYIKWSSKI